MAQVAVNPSAFGPEAHSSVVGGSSAERVLNCPGSIKLLQQVRERPSSIYAEEGTAQHHAMEYILLNNLQAAEVLGMTFNGFKMEASHIEALEYCVDAFEKIVGDYEFEIERRDPLPLIEGAFGTADIVYFDHGRLLGLMDWKFGEGKVVDPRQNLQMKFYLRAQMHRMGGGPENTYQATIVQPYLDVCETDTYTGADLIQFELDLKAAVEGPETFARGGWCYWCDAKERCPEWGGRQRSTLQKLIDIQNRKV